MELYYLPMITKGYTHGLQLVKCLPDSGCLMRHDHHAVHAWQNDLRAAL